MINVLLSLVLCALSTVAQEPFDFDEFKVMKFFVTHRGGQIVPGKKISANEASCVAVYFQQIRSGNLSFIVEFKEDGRVQRIGHLCSPTVTGFNFRAVSGAEVEVEVVDTDYSNYAITMYKYADRRYPIVMATHRSASTTLRQRFLELMGTALVSLEVIENGGC